MSTVTLYVNNSLAIDSRPTGYYVDQQRGGTKVLRCGAGCLGSATDLGPEIVLDAQRYTLSSPEGRAAFDADFLAAFEAAKAAA
jgi:hypothetical protein